MTKKDEPVEPVDGTGIDVYKRQPFIFLSKGHQAHPLLNRNFSLFSSVFSLPKFRLWDILV